MENKQPKQRITLKPNGFILHFNAENVCIGKHPIHKDGQIVHHFGFIPNEDDIQSYGYVTQEFIDNKPHGYVIVREPESKEIRLSQQTQGTSKYIGNGYWV